MPPTRRDFLAAAGGASLVIGFGSAGCRPAGTAADPPVTFEPNQWLRIDGTGRVTVVNDKSEMGQGSATAVPIIVAEELGVPISAVTVIHAEPGPAFDDMGTSGSDTASSRWTPLRMAAAAAREMLLTAAATQWSVPASECSADGGVIAHAGSKRRLRFGALVAAASKLPVPKEPPLKPATAYRLVGTRVPRLDLGTVVTGAKQYAGDLRLPGMRFATLARCPTPGGKPTTWNGDAAKRIAGVHDVIAVADGIAIVADSTWATLKAREALVVEWDLGPHRALDSKELWARLERARNGKVARVEGNAAKNLGAASRRLEAEYRYPFQAHAAVEPLTAVARWDGDRCELWVGTQNPNHAQREVAAALGIDPSKVTIHVLPLGGGFGRRIAADYAVEAALIAKAAPGHPIQLLWTREDDFRYDMFQSAAIVRMSAGLDGAGKLTAWRHDVSDFHLTMFGDFDPTKYKPAEDGEPWGGIDTPYDFPALEVRLGRLRSPVRTGAWRSVFYPSSVTARECFLDEIAHETKQDPLALRLELVANPKEVTRRGTKVDNHARLRQVLQLAADRAGWATPLPPDPTGRRVGRGIACNEYHRSTMVANVAEISVGADDDIVVHRIVSAMDCGRVVNLDGTEAQVEGGVIWALSILFGREVTFAAGRAEQTTFEAFPVLRIGQTPKIECHLVTSDLHPSGVGEQPVPPILPAVLNAIFAATGRRIRRLPLSSA